MHTSHARSGRRCGRYLLLFIAGTAFVTLQLVLFTVLVSRFEKSLRDADIRVDFLPSIIFTEPTAQPAVEPEEFIDAPFAPPDVSAPALAHSGAEAALPIFTAANTTSWPSASSGREQAGRRRRVDSLAWDFAAPTHAEGSVALHGCLGKGTYGAVLNGTTATGAAVIVKVPVLRHWGFTFYRAELRALEAVASATRRAGGYGGVRNVVRLLGNTTVSIAWLLARSENVSDGAVDGHTTWDCLNHTDLRLSSAVLRVPRLPAMLLEPVQAQGRALSVFKWLSTVAAPTVGASLDTQRRVFRAQLSRVMAAEPPLRDAFRAAFSVLIGVCRGLATLHHARVIHRDLTEPGKNALLKADGGGMTAALIDLSQAEVCPAGRGAASRGESRRRAVPSTVACRPQPTRRPSSNPLLAPPAFQGTEHPSSSELRRQPLSRQRTCPCRLAARGDTHSRGFGPVALAAVDMYAFGNILYYACYGHVAHSLPWTKYSCMGASRGLVELRTNHRRLHSNGRVAPPGTLNRCHEKLRTRLDDLMQYAWAPALVAAEAAQADRAAPLSALGANVSVVTSHQTPPTPSSGASPGEAAARLNHTWAYLIEQLEVARGQRWSLFRAMPGAAVPV